MKTFCKPCIEVLGEEKGREIWFPNKKDCIIQHFKKCPNFLNKTMPEEREEIFQLNITQNLNKRPCKF